MSTFQRLTLRITARRPFPLFQSPYSWPSSYTVERSPVARKVLADAVLVEMAAAHVHVLPVTAAFSSVGVAFFSRTNQVQEHIPLPRCILGREASSRKTLFPVHIFCLPQERVQAKHFQWGEKPRGIPSIRCDNRESTN